MADAKRYYWLRLYDDFFGSKRIKKLRKMAGGDTYTIIYLKMQLVAMKTDGVLSWTGLEDSFAEELALDLDEEPDDVRVTLSYLLHCGLAETSDDINFFFPYAVANTGSENASAQRVREHRKKQKVLQCNTDALQCNTNVTQVKQLCNAEKEIDTIDIDIDIDIDKNKKTASPIDDFSPDVQEAIKSFMAMRKKQKKPMTDNAINRLCQKLKKLSSNPGDQIKILNRSEDNCWLDIYPLKQDKPQKATSAQGDNIFLQIAKEEGII